MTKTAHNPGRSEWFSERFLYSRQTGSIPDTRTMIKEPNFTHADSLIFELGVRVVDALYFENTGNFYHRTTTIKYRFEGRG